MRAETIAAESLRRAYTIRLTCSAFLLPCEEKALEVACAIDGEEQRRQAVAQRTLRRKGPDLYQERTFLGRVGIAAAAGVVPFAECTATHVRLRPTSPSPTTTACRDSRQRGHLVGVTALYGRQAPHSRHGQRSRPLPVVPSTLLTSSVDHRASTFDYVDRPLTYRRAIDIGSVDQPSTIDYVLRLSTTNISPTRAPFLSTSGGFMDMVF